MLPITLPQSTIDVLSTHALAAEPFEIDLPNQTISVGNPVQVKFEFTINEYRKKCLLGGLDDIALTLQNEESILAFENKRSIDYPWLDGIGYVAVQNEKKVTDW
jgi:3-isopropylmalate dehydratase